jgi:hypothetical protein
MSDSSGESIAAIVRQALSARGPMIEDDLLPALDGDGIPTRRPDLIRLLESFPQDTGQPGTMSPSRLRAALGLD